MARNPHGFAFFGLFPFQLAGHEEAVRNDAFKSKNKKKETVGEREYNKRKQQQKQQQRKIFNGKQKMFVYRSGTFRTKVFIGAKEGWRGGGRDFVFHVLQVRLSEAKGNKRAARLDQATNEIEVLPMPLLIPALSPSPELGVS